MTPQQALDTLGLSGTPDLTQIDSAHRALLAEVDAELQRATDDATRQSFQQRRNALTDAHTFLLRQTLATATGTHPTIGSNNTVTTNTGSHPAFQAPSGLSATMMADLPGAHPYQTALGTGGNMAQIASLQPGHVLANRFEIKAQIGAGGMGAVYRAHDRNRGEDIAVKVMLPGLISSNVAKQRFLNEAKIAIKLGHQHIVNTYDVQIDGAYIFITMELLEGTNLRQLMTEKKQQHQQWEEKEVLDIIRPLCEALTYAHRFTIHRDIKPENVWINRDGSIKLMDFGIARLMTDSQMTQTSAVLGTAYYMAPEQLTGAKGVDHRADQYSVGVMVYELLTERIPTGRFKQINEIRDDISQGLSDAVDKALAGHPEDRYESMTAFAQGLEQVGTGRKKGAQITAKLKGLDKENALKLKRTAIAATVLLVVVVLGVVGYPYLQNQYKEHKASLAEEEAQSKRQRSKELSLANAALNKKNYAKAVQLYTPLAAQGDAIAQANLGWMYDTGNGINKDEKEAVKWYRLAADQGLDDAQSNLGLSYEYGQGVEKDIREAKKWFRLAAAQGNTTAKEHLESLENAVEDVPQENSQPSKWYQILAGLLVFVGIAFAVKVVKGKKLKSAVEGGAESLGQSAAPNSKRTETIKWLNQKRAGTWLAVSVLAAVAGLFLTSSRDCPDCPKMVVIPSGQFEMGSDMNGPIHSVTISRDFAMGKTEVTQGQWAAIMGSNPSFYDKCGVECPVEQVSWNDIQKFIQKLNAKTGKQYRLPSEAEWEYACRAGGRHNFCGGDDAENLGWLKENSGDTLHPVGGKQPNAFGLYDMTGNVSEFVQDNWHDDYEGAPINGSAWEGADARIVKRGGPFHWDKEMASLRQDRLYDNRDDHAMFDGFRLALTQPPQVISWYQFIAALLVLVGLTSVAKMVGEKSRKTVVGDGINPSVESGDNLDVVENKPRSWVAKVASQYDPKWVMGAALGLVGLVWLSYPYALAKFEEHEAEIVKQSEAALNEFSNANYEAAIKLYTPLAEQGDALAQTQLGWMFDTGKGVPPNDYEAIKWYLLAAGQGHPIAQSNLGLTYQYDVQDNQEAVKWYRLAASQGDAKAKEKLEEMKGAGEKALLGNGQTATWYLVLAAFAVLAVVVFVVKVAKRKSPSQAVEGADNPVAGTNIPGARAATAIKRVNLKWFGGAGLGLIALVWLLYPYMYVKYVEHIAAVAAAKAEIVTRVDVARKELDNSNYEMAAKLYTPLAEQGIATAQTNLGWMYQFGNGVPKNINKAIELYRQAAKQGESAAQNNLGFLYESGEGVPQDTKLMLEWYRLSADQGNANAGQNLGILYFDGKKIPQDYNEAAKWYRMAAEKGNSGGQFQLGWMYDQGLGVRQDRSEAVKWYRLAADQGHPTAQFNLGVAYQNGVGVPQNIKEAEKWYRLSAAQGDVDAIANLEKLQPKKVKQQPKEVKPIEVEQVKPIEADNEPGIFKKLFGR